MKRTRHSPERIIAKLREADALLGGGATVDQVCQKLGVAEATFHRWPHGRSPQTAISSSGWFSPAPSRLVVPR